MTLKTGVMMLNIQFCITGISCIVSFIIKDVCNVNLAGQVKILTKITTENMQFCMGQKKEQVNNTQINTQLTI